MYCIQRCGPYGAQKGTCCVHIKYLCSVVCSPIPEIRSKADAQSRCERVLKLLRDLDNRDEYGSEDLSKYVTISSDLVVCLMLLFWKVTETGMSKYICC